MMTREEYMTRERVEGYSAHRAYYAQFVTPELIDAVVDRVGRDAILQATDKYLNEVPLARWGALERLARRYSKTKLLGQTQGYRHGKYSWSVLYAVCIAKEAARMFRDEHQV